MRTAQFATQRLPPPIIDALGWPDRFDFLADSTDNEHVKIVEIYSPPDLPQGLRRGYLFAGIHLGSFDGI